MTLEDLQNELAALADPERAKNLAWFFKTGKGEYGEGDQFLGIRVPFQRKLAHRYVGLHLADVARLLKSPIHEHRFTAAEILVAQYEKAGGGPPAEKIFRFYLRYAKLFNNWDLVDTSAPYIAGAHLLHRPRDPLYGLARSANVWERRIGIVATFAFLRSGDVEDTFQIAEMLLADEHDLIHKSVGWALREAGRTSRKRLLAFLQKHYTSIPRTTLRYAIEHLPDTQRRQILAGKF